MRDRIRYTGGVTAAEKHLSPRDLAEREGVPLETVYMWNKKRTGPRYMKIGVHVRYRLGDVIAWEESRLVAGGTV